MKKIIGWVLIIFCSLFLLLFALFLIISLFELATGNSRFHMAGNEILGFIAAFLITISIFVLGLINGIKKVKEEKIAETIDYNKILNIQLTGKIEYKDYRNLILGITFKKPVYLIAFLISISSLSNL